jgi:hypothetical protein
MMPSPAQWQSATASANGAPQKPGLVGCPKTQPRIAINWRAYSFGRIRKGSALPVHELVIQSTGGVDLAAITVTLTGDQFKIDNPGGYAQTLAPGKTTKVKIKFEPTSYGEKNGKIRITSNAVNENPIDVSVKGRQYSVITFIVQDDTSGARIKDAQLKVKQAGEPEQVVTTGPHGRVRVETEKDGNFEIQLGDYKDLLEFRSLTTT